MSHPTLRLGIVAIAAVASFLAPIGIARAQSAVSKAWQPPRTIDGKPDLQGIWSGGGEHVGSARSVDIEEHPKTAFLSAGPTLVVDPPDGNIPYQPWALAKKHANVNAQYEFIGAVDPNTRCFLHGVPRHVYAPHGFQILQAPGYLVIQNEQIHTYRVIRTDGRPHIDSRIKLWMGDSVGRWEGDTLVVDVTNLNGEPWLDIAGHLTSETLHVVERWTLINPDTIQYEATFTDPNLFTRPWKMAFDIKRNTTPGYEMMESACFEGERSLQHMPSTAR